MNERIYTFKDGRETIFDAEDIIWICQYNLQITAKGYVTAQCRLNGKQWSKPVHRMIMNAPSGVLVDHINGDRRDNRKCNLRLVNDFQNMRNAKKRQATTAASQYKGVNRCGAHWQARISTDNGRLYLGYFRDEKLAAEAYNKAAIIHHGEYALLNIIN